MESEHRDQFGGILKSFGINHRPYSLFSDFCTLSAASLSNSMRQFQPPDVVERRENEYLQCAKRYAKGELEKMAQLLGVVTMAFEANPDQDFLGRVYMNLDFGNDRTGQFFTPYHITKMMASMNLADASSELKTRRYIRICDPCVGGGSMLIAAYNAAKEEGVNPQTRLLFYGCYIDGIVLRMAYVQCSLLGLCGHFVHGNSLTAEQWDTFTTPMYYLNAWRFGPDGERNEIEMPEAVTEEERLGVEALSEVTPHAPGAVVRQLTLF